MSLLWELYEARIALYEKEEQLAKKEEELNSLKEEYDHYRKIVETNCDNKKVRKIKNHISWYSREQLKKKAKKVAEQEWLDYSCNEARRRQRREGRREREEKKRAAERKALEELMEKERKERQRKNQEAN